MIVRRIEMPYISVNITNKLSESEKDFLKSQLGQLITIIPDKSEDVLMIGINDCFTIYFAGEKKEKSAFVDIKVFGKAETSYKSELTKAIFALFATLFGITGDNLFLTFTESDNWGFKNQFNLAQIEKPQAPQS
jgi:phenylpyruvate tautomerase PptA (4-oxalocrotonate tautomerase family)